MFCKSQVYASEPRAAAFFQVSAGNHNINIPTYIYIYIYLHSRTDAHTYLQNLFGTIVIAVSRARGQSLNMHTASDQHPVALTKSSVSFLFCFCSKTVIEGEQGEITNFKA